MPKRSRGPSARALQILASAVFCAAAAPGFSASLLTPGDRTLAIDRDVGVFSGSFDHEGAANVLDGNAGTKYLNFAGPNSGFIVTPAPQTTAQAIQFTTANDAPERDPRGWALYGTLDIITSTNHSAGTNENWVLIAEGTVTLTDERLTTGPLIPFDNWELYDSYRVVFTSVKGASTLMQVGEVQMFDEFNSPILAAGQPIVAIQLPRSQSRYPSGESAARAIDGVTSTKYLNYGRENTGFIVTPSVGPSVIQSFTVTTANDEEGRDPLNYELFGSNDPIASKDNSTGTAENWTLIASGDLNLPAERETAGAAIALNNTTEYRSYKIVFPENKGPDEGAVDSIQIGDVSFEGIVSPQGSAILRGSDRVLAVDRDVDSFSGYPGGESPAMAIDANPASKYLNTRGRLTGFIVTPPAASVVRSFRMVTANDAPERDPAAWALYGTTDLVTSPDNSAGTNENWTLIGSGTVAMPDERGVSGPVVAVNNEASYTAYKLIFTGLKQANSSLMQVAEVQFYEQSDASDAGILTPSSLIIATALLRPESSYPAPNEAPSRALDGNVNTKYLNFGRENSGFIVVPSAGPSIVRNVSLVTANDSIGRDPATFELYGTREAIASQDNSQGTNENWTLIASGPLNLPDTRLTTSDPVVINNTIAYTAYKILFPQLKATNANSMQVAEVRFQGSVVRMLDVDPGNFSVTARWESSSGAIYNLYYSQDLVTWHLLAENVAGEDRSTTRTFTNPAPGTSKLFLKVGQP